MYSGATSLPRTREIFVPHSKSFPSPKPSPVAVGNRKGGGGGEREAAETQAESPSLPLPVAQKSARVAQRKPPPQDCDEEENLFGIVFIIRWENGFPGNEKKKYYLLVSRDNQTQRRRQQGQVGSGDVRSSVVCSLSLSLKNAVLDDYVGTNLASPVLCGTERKE